MLEHYTIWFPDFVAFGVWCTVLGYTIGILHVQLRDWKRHARISKRALEIEHYRKGGEW